MIPSSLNLVGLSVGVEVVGEKDGDVEGLRVGLIDGAPVGILVGELYVGDIEGVNVG